MVANQLVDVVDRIIGFAEDKDASFRARVPALLLLSQSPASKVVLESLAKDPDIVVQGNAQNALRALTLP